MIDPQQLRDLGWSEAVVAEVIRIAEAIRRDAERLPASEGGVVSSRSVPATTLVLEQSRVSTGTALTAPR